MVAGKHNVFVLPFPVQSHINPMLEFSKCLAQNDDLKVTFIMTTKLSKSMPKITLNTSNISIESISDGSEEVEEPQSTAGLFRRLKEAVSKSLAELIEQETPPKLLVYDSVFPWMLDIARQHAMLGAPFFTQSCAVSAIYHHIKQGLLKFPFEHHLKVVELPLLPSLGIHDLPLLEKVMDSEQTMLKVLASQFSNLDDAHFVLFNTFHMLENEVLNWMTSCWTTKTIGPTHLLLEKDTNHSHKNNHTINLFEPNQEACTKWLDSRDSESVIYVSFGSLVSLEQSQMEELAWGLLKSKCDFLWVVRASEEHKLPPNFTSLAIERGLIVNWCSQTEVLAHRAVSCFLTHGGWNSTLEGLSYGVPLIVMPHWVDQTTNAKFVEDVWKVGVRVRADENGTISRDQVCMCVREVGEGERGLELRRNACKWKKLAMEAVDDGGTTSNNIKDIVSRILS